MFVRTYSRAQLAKHFDLLGAGNKQQIAEMIAKYIPALALYVPPPRKPWTSEDRRLAIFDAVGLAWLYFREADADREAA
jgi:hypothetical protein